MTASYVNNELVCVHPCMQVDHSIYSGSLYGSQTISGNFDFSQEMVEFLAKLSRGQVDWKSETAKRCFLVATRKGCYPEPLMHPMGFPTDVGERAILDAKIIQARIQIYHHVNGTTGNDAAMDEIIVFGNISNYAIRMLQLLWDLVPDDRKPIKGDGMPPVPYSWDLAKITIEGETYALMGSVRHNIHIRKAIDSLIKFGLVDLLNLPKPPENRGKGRAPVGFHISPVGIKFYQNYLENFDAKTKFSLMMSEPAPQWFAQGEENNTSAPSEAESEMSDVVDGENLRDLFG